MSRIGGIVLLAVSLAPLVSAAEGTGTFLIARETTLPPGTRLNFEPLLILGDDAMGITDLRVKAPVARLRVFEQRLLEASNPVVHWRHQMDVREVKDVILHSMDISLLPEPEAGFVTIQTQVASPASLDASSGVVTEARTQTSETNEHWLLGDDNRSSRDDYPVYKCTVQIPHMFTEARGLLRYDGAGALKILGPNLWVESAEWSGPLWTGFEDDLEEPVQDRSRRWLILELTDANISMASNTPWKLAAPAFTTEWAGTAVFLPIEGEMTTPGARYSSTGQRTQVQGTFEADVRPLQRGAALVTRLDLQGTLESTTLRTQAVPLAAQAVRNPLAGPWLLVGLAVVVAAAGGYRAALVRRRGAIRPLRDLTVEDCVEAGCAAASQDDWPEAAAWFVRAHKLAPTSARLCADAAFALSQIADHDEALRLFEEASRLSSDGEADFNGALAALHAGRPPEEVERWLARCLLRSPEMVLNLDEDDEFAHLRGRSAYEGILAQAWRAVHERGFG